MERSNREARRRPSMAASNGFLRLREQPNKRSIMREQSRKQRRLRAEQDQESTEEESVSYHDEERASKQTTPLKVPREMIGVAVPRKARSASGKRSREYASANCGEEQSLQQLSVKAASLSFSNVSSRKKKMKPNGPKITRPPKSSKSSSPVEEAIEIEIAEVLYGLMKQSQSSASNLEAKDRNDKEEKKVKAESASMALQSSSAAEAVEVEGGDQSEKIEACSPMGGSEGASGSMESQMEDAKPVMEEEKSILPKVELSWEDSTGTKAVELVGVSAVSERKGEREDGLDFDLMASPPMERDDSADVASDPNPPTQDVEMKMDVWVKNEEKVGRRVEEAVHGNIEEKKMDENPSQHQGTQEQQPKAFVSKLQKTAHSSSVPLPFGVAGCPSGRSPTGSSTTLQPADSHLSQPGRKRCTTHRYIAHNIHLHQQVAKTNNLWPAASSSVPLSGTREQVVSNLPSHRGNDRNSEAANFMETSQRKHFEVQQAPQQPASASNQMHGPTSVFPMGQHQASVTPKSNQSGPSKHANSTNKASISSKPRSSSSALPTVAAVNFNNPNMTAKEGPYSAIKGYPLPISTQHIGTAPASKGGNPAQAVPFFSSPFYSNQMFHPSQVQQQQLHSQLQHQVQPTHPNTSTSSDSTPSHKQQKSQKQREAQFSSSNFFTSTGTQLQQSQKQHVPSTLQSCKLDGEMNGENTTWPAASHAQKGVYGQNFAVPFQPLNFTLMPYVTMGGAGVGNHIEQSQHGMSFASFSGNIGTGSCLNFSTVAQNPAIFQSLPDIAGQGYKDRPSPQAAQQKNHHRQISERKTGVGSNNADDGLKAASGKSSSNMGQKQTLVFDNSAKTLNFMSSPVTGSWPSRSITLATATTNAPVDFNTSSNSQQQHLFQFQLQNPHLLQQQPATCSKFPKSSMVMSFPQQQRRASQGQTQISFGGNPKSSSAPQGQQRLTSNQSSSSLVACSSVSTLHSQQPETSSPGGNGQMSSPACGRNLPSILNSCPSHISELKY